MADKSGETAADKNPVDAAEKQISKSDDAVAKSAASDDADLDDLLDSALNDFGKPPPTGSTQQVPAGNQGNASLPSYVPTPGGVQFPGMPAGGSVDQEALFNELFTNELQSTNFEDAMKAFLGDESGMQDQLNQLLHAAENVDEQSGTQQEFTDTLQQTLGSLMQNSQNLQQGGLAEEDLLRSMSGLGLGGLGAGGEAGEAELLPMMQSMMKNLLSKEVLYPSLKEISEKYPGWLDQNKETLKTAEFTRYSRQRDIISGICEEFEKESSVDTDEQKKQRFEKVLELMQKMQDCGQPPKDIVGDMAPGLEFDEQGNPKLPGMSADQCLLM